MSLLIVEDDEVLRAVLARIASRYFDDVADVHDGDSALVEIDSKPPQVLLTDWDLGGGLSGIDVATYVKTFSPDCTLVLITGNSLSQLQALTKHLDVYAYLAKPFNLESIRSVLQEIVLKE